MSASFTTPGIIFMVSIWLIIIGFLIYSFSKVLLKKKVKAVIAISDLARERWASRVGLIMAMAGNAIGLGNFLRFPVKAAANGGGAFLIPYFAALILLGIPLMWVEWTIGRYGGRHGHGTTPGMLSSMWKSKYAKYVGTIGLMIPFIIVVYYTFIESWTLGYSWFSLTGQYFGNTTSESMSSFLAGFQGMESNEFFPNIGPLLVFVGITIFINYFFLRKGLSKGIETLAKIGMPVLFVLAIVMVIRVFTIGRSEFGLAGESAWHGLAFMWNPDFSRLSESEVWLVATGQVFFTLSLGQGVISTYASYLKENEDVTLNGLATSMTNEFAEVILGGTIAIPLSVAFFGISATQQIASGGAFNLGFVSLPVIFQEMPLGQLWGAMWFFLLFIAGITSSVALASPSVAFLSDEFGWVRKKSVNVVFVAILICTSLVIAFFRFGFLDELDYWAGTFGLVVFATIEVIIFAWVFGIDKAWAEMHKGADLKIPLVFKFIIKYVTPVYLIIMLSIWAYQEAFDKLIMKDAEKSDQPYLWLARMVMLIVLVLSVLLVRKAWKRRSA